MFCARCGRSLPPGSRFCVYCGETTSSPSPRASAAMDPPASRSGNPWARVLVACCLLFAALLVIGALLVQSLISTLSDSEATVAPVANEAVVPIHLPIATPRASATEVEAVDLARRSVVQISTPSGTGTGVALTSDGYVLTNYHVVEDGGRVTLRLPNGRRADARLIVGSESPDLALLKTSSTDLTPAGWADSDRLPLGQTVIAIGHALDFEGEPTISRGIVSAARTLRGVRYVQTDAALNPGNSGGPLIDTQGAVVGINTLRVERSGFRDIQRMNFAIAASEVREWLAMLGESP